MLDKENIFRGRGLFVFSDPGGAKAILGLILELNLKNYKVISDRTYDFYKDFQIFVHKLNNSDEFGLMNSFNPNYVFTASSYTSNIELKYLKIAKEKLISTYCFIDHYTNYKSRFKLNNEYIYPDNIWVTDEKAKKVALSENLNDFSNIRITGNYFHSYIQKWKPKTSKRDFYIKYNLDINKQTIVFAPDPISNLGGRSKYGFDESDVCNLITRFYSNKLVSKKFNLVFKLHPNQKLENIFKKKHDQNIIILSNLNNENLIFYSTIIIGVYSSFLIEASIMNKPIIRLLLSDKTIDPLKSLNIGTVCKNYADFDLKFKSLLS